MNVKELLSQNRNDREALLSSISEPATNRNLEEQLLKKSPEKTTTFFCSKDATCIAITWNFTSSKAFTNLALLLLLIDLVGFKFRSLT